MDKNRMNNDRKNDFPEWFVHRLPGSASPLQEKYGLRIIDALDSVSPPDSFEKCPWRYFEFYSISHLLGGRGRLIFRGGQECDILPGDAVVMPPGVVHRYGGYMAEYREESIIFNGEIPDRLLKCRVLTAGVFRLGPEPVLGRIMKLFRDPADESQIAANFELQKLIMELYFRAQQRHPDELDRIIEALKSDLGKWWTVKEMAAACGLSDDQFRRNFRKRTGLLPKAYVEQVKLRAAAGWIASGEFPLGKIAGELGYMDFFHFSRRFKRMFGVSPAGYRKTIPRGGNF